MSDSGGAAIPRGGGASAAGSGVAFSRRRRRPAPALAAVAETGAEGGKPLNVRALRGGGELLTSVLSTCRCQGLRKKLLQ